MLTKSATSPRAAADLIMRATSAPNTYIFAELLQNPKIRELAQSSEDLAPYVSLLHIFSHGTYASLKDVPNLPNLSDAQKLKLRQLSLLSFARESNHHAVQFNNSAPVLGYASLLSRLDLGAARELEELVISAVYAGLIEGQLDPKNKLVRIDRVAALRDVAPGSAPSASGTEGTAIGGLLSSLQAWASRCEATLSSLEAQMAGLRADADRRAAQAAGWSEKMGKLTEEESKRGKASGSHKSNLLTLGVGSSASSRGASGSGAGRSATAAPPTVTGSTPGGGASLLNVLRHGSKRGAGTLDASGNSDIDETMDLDDDGPNSAEGSRRSSKRKVQG